MNTNVQKWTQTFSTIENFQNQGRGDVRTIPLLKCPRTLDILWTECEFGLNGNKAAKFVTAREREKVKYSYSLR